MIILVKDPQKRCRFRKLYKKISSPYINKTLQLFGTWPKHDQNWIWMIFRNPISPWRSAHPSVALCVASIPLDSPLAIEEPGQNWGSPQFPRISIVIHWCDAHQAKSWEFRLPLPLYHGGDVQSWKEIINFVLDSIQDLVHNVHTFHNQKAI